MKLHNNSFNDENTLNELNKYHFSIKDKSEFYIFNNTISKQSSYIFDYIFNNDETFELLFKILNTELISLLNMEKNLTFVHFGQESICTYNFFIMEVNSNFIFNNSYYLAENTFFKNTLDLIIYNLLKENKIDIILIDISKTSKEKFLLDLVNIFLKFIERSYIQFPMQYY